MKSFAPSAPAAPRPRAGADILLAIDTSTEFCSVAVCLPVSVPLAEHVAVKEATADVADVADAANPPPGSAIVEPARRGAAQARASMLQRTVSETEATAATVALESTARVFDDVARGLRFVVVERDTGAVSSTYVLPAIDQALQAAGVTLQDCVAVAFGAGPGSFTGLRTATGIVQGLAFAAGLPVLPVNTLMACAESARLRGVLDFRDDAASGNVGDIDVADGANGAGVRYVGDKMRVMNVVAAVDARMNECYHQAFQWSGEPAGWQAVDDALTDSGARVANPEAVLSPWHSGATAAGDRYAVVGNAVSVFGERLSALSGATLSDAAARPDAAAVASIGWHAWQTGQALPAALALPNYVRNKVAQTTAEREQARQEKDAARGHA